jgi:hypothetical protein
LKALILLITNQLNLSFEELSQKSSEDREGDKPVKELIIMNFSG